MLSGVPDFSSRAQILRQGGPNDLQVVLVEARLELRSVRWFCAAAEAPSLVISVVIPCESLLNERLSISSASSD